MQDKNLHGKPKSRNKTIKSVENVSLAAKSPNNALYVNPNSLASLMTLGNEGTEGADGDPNILCNKRILGWISMATSVQKAEVFMGTLEDGGINEMDQHTRSRQSHSRSSLEFARVRKVVSPGSD